MIDEKVLIERLEEEKEIAYADFDKYANDYELDLDDEYDDFYHNGLGRAIKIVKDLASEHNNRWIPCSERLPDTEHISGVSETVLVTTNNNSIFTAEYHKNGTWLDDVCDWSLEVIAWQPLPEPYKKGE